MSTGVCGVIRTSFKEVREEVKLAFDFERIANNLAIGSRLGGNISKYVYDKYFGERGKKNLIFELTDSPLDIHAEELFAPRRYESREPLSERMNRVQKLLETILELEGIIKISLDINYLFESGNEDEVSVRVSDFCEKMIQMDNQNEEFPPVLRLEIF